MIMYDCIATYAFTVHTLYIRLYMFTLHMLVRMSTSSLSQYIRMCIYISIVTVHIDVHSASVCIYTYLIAEKFPRDNFVISRY